MSNYKDQLFRFFGNIPLVASQVLSIGAQEDDRRYFKSTQYDDWHTLDCDQRFRPTFQLDMNMPILSNDGDLLIAQDYADSYDMVMCLNLFEYIWNPVAAHDNLNFFLKSGGTLWVNYPFVYPQHEPAGTDYMRYTPEGARRLLTEAGFTIEQIHEINGNSGLLKFYQQDGMKARANANHSLIGIIVRATKP